jgi:exopolysaccharide production protein ExoQ
MEHKKNQQTLESLLVFFAVLLSNFSAFIGVIWLIPRLVFIETLLWLILATFTIWLLNKNNLLSEFVKNLKKNWIILPFLFFSGFSIFWSVLWYISLSRWLILIFTIIVGGYIGLRYNFQEMIRILSDYGIWILFLGVFLVLFMPYVGVHNYINMIHDAWKGLYWHKNHMGLIASFVSILFLINIINSFRVKGKQIFIWIFLYLFSLYFIFKSDSVAAYITTLVINGGILLALVWLKVRNKIKKNHYLLFIIILVVISIVLFMNIDRFFGIFNRNTTLTGRIPLWTHLYNNYISKRPYLGYGFNAFWYHESHRVAMQEAVGYHDPIDLSDNGFIDILVNTGFIGLCLFLIFYLGIWWRSIKYALKANDINGFFPLVVMSFTLIANITWSLIFENESFLMLIMISVLFYISKNEFHLESKSTPTSLLIEHPSE